MEDSVTDMSPRICDKSISGNGLARPAANAAIARIEGLAPFSIETHDYGADEYILREINDLGTWEPFETELVRRLLPAFDLFMDIGANVGWYTCVAQRVMREGSAIHAFEPDPQNLAILRRNVRSFPHSRTFVTGTAVTDFVGRALLHKSESNLGDHRLYPSAEGRQTVKVPTTTLDAYCGGRPLPPRLVKMDIQGSEPKIFRGGKKTLSPQDADSVFILEFWPYGIDKAGNEIDSYIDYLERFAQVTFEIDETARKFRLLNWNDLKRRVKTEMTPASQWHTHFLTITPGSAPYYTINDLVDEWGDD